MNFKIELDSAKEIKNWLHITPEEITQKPWLIQQAEYQQVNMQQAKQQVQRKAHAI